MTRDASDLRVLILANADSAYCTAARDWARVLYRHQAKSWILNYTGSYWTGGRAALAHEVLDAVRAHSIDVVYFAAPFLVEFELEFLMELRDRAFVVLVVDDSALFFNDWLRYIAQAVDLVLSHDYVETYRFVLYGVKSLFFPQFSNPEEYFARTVDIDKKDIDVSFIGRADRVRRREFLRAVMRRGIDIEVYGEGTPNGPVTASAKLDLYARTKIGLNFAGCAEYFHSRSVKKIDKRIRQVKGRLWELALSKVMILTEYAPCLEASFEIGKELDVFEDEEELAEKIAFYLHRDDRRHEVALRGFARASRDVAPAAACQRVMTMIGELIPQKRQVVQPVYLDGEFEVLVAKERARRVGRFLTAGRVRLAREEISVLARSRHAYRAGVVWGCIKELLRPGVRRFPQLVAVVRGARAKRSIPPLVQQRGEGAGLMRSSAEGKAAVQWVGGAAMKRGSDCVLAAIGLLLAAPFVPLIALLIVLDDPGPVFYGQERVGKGGRLFRSWKFRSMVLHSDATYGPRQAGENDHRVTRVGRFLRAMALDELPQLWNILTGDMSFVGPRALMPAEIEVHGDGRAMALREIPGYDARHRVRPGLTGLAQVYASRDVPRRKKFRYDLLYIRRQSFPLDMKLVAISVWITLTSGWESRHRRQLGRRASALRNGRRRLGSIALSRDQGEVPTDR